MHICDCSKKGFEQLLSSVHEGTLVRLWEDDINGLHNRFPSLLVNPFRSWDVDWLEMDVELFVDNAKGIWLFRSAVCFNNGPGRLHCFYDGCG